MLGLQDWVLSGRQQDLIAYQGQVMADLANTKRTSMKFGWWRDFWIQILVLILVVSTTIWAGTQFAESRMAVNFIAAFVLAIFPLVDSFLGVNQGVSEASFYEDSMTRLNELPVPEAEVTTPKTIKTPTIVLNNVTFKYGDKVIISQLDLVVKAGEKVAILGRSGSGKTTLLKLIAGDIVPESGHVTIGNESVQSLKQNLSKFIAVLDQQSYLFDTTILNNVRMGNIGATDDQVKAAITQAGLQPLIDSLPEKYHTKMQEAGARFSGGEQQRFALARILLQNAPIVILDEPTVGLDPKTEHQVLRQIFKVLQNRTIIWVTHHLTGIDEVNHAYFLSEGHFILSDTPEKLRTTSTHFQKLLAMDDFH